MENGNSFSFKVNPADSTTSPFNLSVPFCLVYSVDKMVYKRIEDFKQDDIITRRLHEFGDRNMMTWFPCGGGKSVQCSRSDDVGKTGVDFWNILLIL